MANFDMKIEGTEKLEKALNTLPLAFARSITGPATAATARVIARNLRPTIPVKTGALRKSVRVARIKDWVRNIEVKGGASIVRMGGVGARHAHLIEFGAVTQPAQHLMRKASEKGRSEQHAAFVKKSATEFEKTIRNVAEGKITASQADILAQS